MKRGIIAIISCISWELNAQVALPTFQAVHYANSGTVTLTNCSSTGKSGPSQSDCNSEYSGTSLEGLVTVTSGIQKWIVPYSTTYTIEAYGAEGGGSYGGKGAKMSGDFSLGEGDVIIILVGQKGLTSSPMSSGGGGTFVVKQSGSTQNGTTSTSGQTGYGGWQSPQSGGSSGNGGYGTSGTGGGGGGGGFSGNGTGYSPGKSFLNGGTGGIRSGGSTTAIDGGFGGGGGARNNSGSFFGGGAGGGYSGGGGAAGTTSTVDNAGGGGSYNSGSNTSNASGNRSGHGQVIISW